MFWKNIEQLESLLQTNGFQSSNFSPRAWTIANMSDEVSARYLLKVIHEHSVQNKNS